MCGHPLAYRFVRRHSHSCPCRSPVGVHVAVLKMPIPPEAPSVYIVMCIRASHTAEYGIVTCVVSGFRSRLPAADSWPACPALHKPNTATKKWTQRPRRRGQGTGAGAQGPGHRGRDAGTGAETQGPGHRGQDTCVLKPVIN